MLRKGQIVDLEFDLHAAVRPAGRRRREIGPVLHVRARIDRARAGLQDQLLAGLVDRDQESPRHVQSKEPDDAVVGTLVTHTHGHALRQQALLLGFMATATLPLGPALALSAGRGASYAGSVPLLPAPPAASPRPELRLTLALEPEEPEAAAAPDQPELAESTGRTLSGQDIIRGSKYCDLWGKSIICWSKLLILGTGAYFGANLIICGPGDMLVLNTIIFWIK